MFSRESVKTGSTYNLRGANVVTVVNDIKVSILINVSIQFSDIKDIQSLPPSIIFPSCKPGTLYPFNSHYCFQESPHSACAPVTVTALKVPWKWNHTAFVFSLAYFTLHDNLEVHPHCS